VRGNEGKGNRGNRDRIGEGRKILARSTESVINDREGDENEGPSWRGKQDGRVSRRARGAVELLWCF